MDYNTLAIIEVAIGVYLLGAFTTLVFMHTEQIRTGKLINSKVLVAFAWPLGVLWFILAAVWMFIDFQAERAASYISLRMGESAKQPYTESKQLAPESIPSVVVAPQLKSDAECIYDDVEYIVKTGAGWYELKLKHQLGVTKVRLTKSYKPGKDPFADALKMWLDQDRVVLELLEE